MAEFRVRNSAQLFMLAKFLADSNNAFTENIHYICIIVANSHKYKYQYETTIEYCFIHHTFVYIMF